MIAEPTARRTGTVLPRAGAAGLAWSGSGSGSGCSTASRVSFTLTPSTVARVVQVGARVDGPLTEEFPAVGRAFRTVGSSDTGPGRTGDPAPQRSEERRVGKEGRAGWAACYTKQKEGAGYVR